MRKILPVFIFLLIFVTLLCRQPLTCRPAPSGWQLQIVCPQKPVQTLPLPTDFSVNGIAYTLADPYIPLRPLAAALGLNISWQQINGCNAVLWPTNNAQIFIADLPVSIHVSKINGGQWAVNAAQQFEQPCILGGSFCVPLSFLDILGINYTIDAENMLVTVCSAPICAAAPTDTIWQAALPVINAQLAATGQLLGEATVTAANTDLAAEQYRLLAAEALHGTAIAPGQAFCPADVLPADLPADVAYQVTNAFYRAANQANLPAAAAARQNNTGASLKITCHTIAGSVTVRIYRLSNATPADLPQSVSALPCG